LYYSFARKIASTRVSKYIHLSVLLRALYPSPQQTGTAAKEGHEITTWNEFWGK